MPRKPRALQIRGFTAQPKEVWDTHVDKKPPAAVRVPPGDVVVPHRFRVGVLLAEPNIVVDLSIEMVAGGEPRVVELLVRSMTGVSSPVTSVMLRAIPVEAITRAAINHVGTPVNERPDLAHGAFQVAGDAPDAFRLSPHPAAGDLATQAAEIYDSAVAGRSRAPTEAVALEMHVSRSQASRYIRAARDAGLLPPAASPIHPPDKAPTNKKGAQ